MLTLAAALVLGVQPALVLKGFDPVEMTAGREVHGRTYLTFDYGRFRYRFASPTNLETFKRDPERYGVQWGGACGKMGALTGRGSPDRWAVVDGKIILFASDGCRETFLKNKQAYFEELATQRATRSDKAAAAKIFESLLNAHGGATAFSAISSYQTTSSNTYNVQGQKEVWSHHQAWTRSGTVADWWTWPRGKSFFILEPSRSSEGNLEGHFQIAKGGAALPCIGDRAAASEPSSRRPVQRHQSRFLDVGREGVRIAARRQGRHLDGTSL